MSRLSTGCPNTQRLAPFRGALYAPLPDHARPGTLDAVHGNLQEATEELVHQRTPAHLEAHDQEAGRGKTALQRTPGFGAADTGLGIRGAHTSPASASRIGDQERRGAGPTLQHRARRSRGPRGPRRRHHQGPRLCRRRSWGGGQAGHGPPRGGGGGGGVAHCPPRALGSGRPGGSGGGGLWPPRRGAWLRLLRR